MKEIKKDRMKAKASIYAHTAQAKVMQALTIFLFTVIVMAIAAKFDSPIPLLTYLILALFIYYIGDMRAALYTDRLRVRATLGKRREYLFSQGKFWLESKPSLFAKLFGSEEGLRIVYQEEGKRAVVVMNELFSDQDLRELYAEIDQLQRAYAQKDEVTMLG
ncbi:hypothetical protein DC082_00900 [Ignatzschineria indica]|uniref:Uncharacterized protein n=2 Tax=Ignatzschineriaceae TaxID=3018589 RepID=A0A2U2ALV0_9GAMM|nr:hypothetical protein B9T19_08400 [Ignatzschineria sp. F8392]PWD84138.1 hypothetical protein DC082_00900 [Ignatzschineria indica]